MDPIIEIFINKSPQSWHYQYLLDWISRRLASIRTLTLKTSPRREQLWNLWMRIKDQQKHTKTTQTRPGEPRASAFQSLSGRGHLGNVILGWAEWAHKYACSSFAVWFAWFCMGVRLVRGMTNHCGSAVSFHYLFFFAPHIRPTNLKPPWLLPSH